MASKNYGKKVIKNLFFAVIEHIFMYLNAIDVLHQQAELCSTNIFINKRASFNRVTDPNSITILHFCRRSPTTQLLSIPLS